MYVSEILRTFCQQGAAFDVAERRGAVQDAEEDAL